MSLFRPSYRLQDRPDHTTLLLSVYKLKFLCEAGGEPARRYGFGLRVQVSFDTRSERETARSAARELSYLDFKPEQLKVVLTFVKGRDVFAVLNNIH